MGEIELDIRALFKILNSEGSEFFVRVILTEEGEMCGEKTGSGINSTGRRTTIDEQCSYPYTF